MAKFSDKMKGKEVGQATVYAKPHTMSGKTVSADLPYEAGKNVIENMNISVGGISKGNYAGINPHGTGVMRGGGAATKGLKISGKMG